MICKTTLNLGHFFASSPLRSRRPQAHSAHAACEHHCRPVHHPPTQQSRPSLRAASRPPPRRSSSARARRKASPFPLGHPLQKAEQGRKGLSLDARLRGVFSWSHDSLRMAQLPLLRVPQQVTVGRGPERSHSSAEEAGGWLRDLMLRGPLALLRFLRQRIPRPKHLLRLIAAQGDKTVSFAFVLLGASFGDRDTTVGRAQLEPAGR